VKIDIFTVENSKTWQKRFKPFHVAGVHVKCFDRLG